jgi:hypothetical protein
MELETERSPVTFKYLSLAEFDSNLSLHLIILNFLSLVDWVRRKRRAGFTLSCLDLLLLLCVAERRGLEFNSSLNAHLMRLMHLSRDSTAFDEIQWVFN